MTLLLPAVAGCSGSGGARQPHPPDLARYIYYNGNIIASGIRTRLENSERESFCASGLRLPRQRGRLVRRRNQVCRIGLRRTQIHDLMSRGEFPRAVRLGVRCVGWLEHEVDAWIAARVAASRAGV